MRPLRRRATFGHPCCWRIRSGGTSQPGKVIGLISLERPRAHADFPESTLRCVRRSWRVPAGERPVREGCSEPPGSECCAGVGDGDCEAYTAIRWGVGLSLERDNVAEAEAVISV